MSTRMLPIEKVVERSGLSRRTIYTEVSAGRFPRPVQLTARRVGWLESDIEAWLQARVAERDAVAA